VSECDREASTMRRAWPTGGCYATEKKNPLFVTDRIVQKLASLLRIPKDSKIKPPSGDKHWTF
jgi:hypothetical protein